MKSEERKSINQLVNEQKKYGEETEFYPTTQEMVNKIVTYIDEKASETIYSILDIGCGNGCFFEKLDKTEKKGFSERIQRYGIEKSLFLIQQLPENVTILGTDFLQNNLIDKEVDLIFCNPPYSQFKEWTIKILKEAFTHNIVLILPSRWQEDKIIKQIMNERNYDYDIIATDNFENAERKARAKVDIIFIHPKKLKAESYETDAYVKDPFDYWFENTFKIKADKEKEYDYSATDKKKEYIKNQIVEGSNIAEVLVRLYNDEMEKLYKNYKAFENMDSELFDELKIDLKTIKENIKVKLKGLKRFYWNELFDHYNKITSRITSEKRREILQKLGENINIDFTEENIYQLTFWIIKNANKLYDEQLSDYFYSLCNTESIQRYQSNKRWNDEEWKYIKDCCSKRDKEDCIKFVQLDYRIVVNSYSNFEYDWWDKRCKGDFTQNGRDFVNDTLIIARNLGFNIPEYYNADMHDRSAYSRYKNIDILTEEGELFCNLKMYQNGNRHLKFNPKFMKKLNIEMARINGWIKDKREAEKEFNMTDTEVNRYWQNNFTLNTDAGLKLIGMAS